MFVFGIGCLLWFFYYMDMYGFYMIYGCVLFVVIGVKFVNFDLDVWVVIGDGDGFFIGGNYLMYVLCCNVDFKIFLFNNEIYGLIKG